MQTGNRCIGGGYILLATSVALAGLTEARLASAGEGCTNHPSDGWRGCDAQEAAPGQCAHGVPWPWGVGAGSYRSDFASYLEAMSYLDALKGGFDDDGYLEVIDVGSNQMLFLYMASANPVEISEPTPTLRVARIAADPSASAVTRPAILLVCGIHAHE
jgi:hypothetical protein